MSEQELDRSYFDLLEALDGWKRSRQATLAGPGFLPYLPKSIKAGWVKTVQKRAAKLLEMVCNAMEDRNT